MLTEAEAGLATSEPEFEDASACVLAGRCPLMPGRGGGEWFITYEDDDSKATGKNKTANTTKQFQICSDSVVSRNSPGA